MKCPQILCAVALVATIVLVVQTIIWLVVYGKSIFCDGIVERQRWVRRNCRVRNSEPKFLCIDTAECTLSVQAYRLTCNTSDNEWGASYADLMQHNFALSPEFTDDPVPDAAVVFPAFPPPAEPPAEPFDGDSELLVDKWLASVGVMDDADRLSDWFVIFSCAALRKYRDVAIAVWFISVATLAISGVLGCYLWDRMAVEAAAAPAPPQADDGPAREMAVMRAPDVADNDVSDAGRRCRCGALAPFEAMVCSKCDAVLLDGVRANAFRFAAPDDKDDDDDDDDKEKSASEDDGRLCPVCLEEFKVGDELVALPCAHVFHLECVARWLESQVACPSCQTPMAESSKRVDKALRDAPLQPPPAAAKKKSGRGSRRRPRRHRQSRPH